MSSNETIRRVKRTFWQVLAGSTLVVLISTLMDEFELKKLMTALATVFATIVTTYAQNVLEDTHKIRDRR